jgi:hypothetical protein
MGETITKNLADPNRAVVSALEELRDDVENLNRHFTGLFRDRVLTGDDICTVTVDGMTYGYKLQDRKLGMMEREILMRPADGDDVGRLSQEEFDRYTLPIMEVFFREGYTDIRPMVIQGCLIFKQKIQIAFLYEHKPGLVVPGGVH